MYITESKADYFAAGNLGPGTMRTVRVDLGIHFKNLGKQVKNLFKGAAKGLTINTIKSNPKALWGKSADEIADVFRSQGYKVTIEQSTKGSGKATMIRIEGGNINMIEIHPGGGRHGSSYIKVSTDKGIMKVVGGSKADYKGNPAEEKATFYWMED